MNLATILSVLADLASVSAFVYVYLLHRRMKNGGS